MYVAVAFMLFLAMSSHAVQMINPFPEDNACRSLSFHGDVVYIGSDKCVIRWNVVTDAVLRLEGYDSLICSTFTHAVFQMILGGVYALAVSTDSSVVVGASLRVLIAHNTTTCAVLWRKEMSVTVWALCIHRGVAVVPDGYINTVVLDATTGHQLHALPSAGKGVYGICVFDGLKLSCDVIFFFHFLTPCYSLSAANEGSLEGR